MTEGVIAALITGLSIVGGGVLGWCGQALADRRSRKHRLLERAQDNTQREIDRRRSVLEWILDARADLVAAIHADDDEVVHRASLVLLNLGAKCSDKRVSLAIKHQLDDRFDDEGELVEAVARALEQLGTDEPFKPLDAPLKPL